jgi:cytochrome c biogenesis protein CcdA
MARFSDELASFATAVMSSATAATCFSASCDATLKLKPLPRLATIAAAATSLAGEVARGVLSRSQPRTGPQKVPVVRNIVPPGFSPGPQTKRRASRQGAFRFAVAMSSCVLILYLLFLAGSSGGLLLTWGFALAVFSLGLLAPFAAVAVLLLKDRRAYRWRIGIDAPNHSRRGEVLRVELNRAQATGGLDLC